MTLREFEVDIPLGRITGLRAGHDGPRVLALHGWLDNAASFAPQGSEVEVTVHRQSPWAILRVADRGPGIPPEHLQRIFDRFFSYRPAAVGANTEAAPANAPGPRLEHPGLGLAIVKAIVEGYGGTVLASNREGGGAVFEVRLPAV